MRCHLAQQCLELDREDLKKAGQLASEAFMAAAARLRRAAEGDYSPDPCEASLPEWRAPAKAVRIPDVWNRYVAEAKPAPNTVKRWKPVLDRLEAHLGHDDLARLSTADVVSWKEALINEKLSNATIGKVHLVVAKRICRFALANGLIGSDPAKSVSISKGKRDRGREQGLSLAEARLVLSKTLQPCGPRTSVHFAAARRWVPWLCAYTGARVNEITQVRGCHIEEVRAPSGELVWMVVITPEAGNQKSHIARKVPLHPQLIEQGFLDFVAKTGTGPLFYDPSSGRGGRDPAYAQIGGKLAKWVRSAGLADLRIDPNHAWRHRFKSVAAEIGMADGICRRIMGHSSGSVSDSYGDLWPHVALREISRIPRYVLLPSEDS